MRAVIPLTREEAEKYAGQWVAIKDERVALAALTAEDLIRQLTEQELEPDLVARIPAPGEPETWIF